MNTDEILLKYKAEKENLIQILHEIQDTHPRQYLAETDLKKVSNYLNISLSSVYGVVGYYSMFSTTPRGKYIIRLCESPVCNMFNSELIAKKLKEILQIDINQTTTDGLFTLELSECLGLCGNKPAMMINKEVYTNLDENNIELIIQNLRNN